jgi:hypothetical protein
LEEVGSGSRARISTDKASFELIGDLLLSAAFGHLLPLLGGRVGEGMKKGA